MSIIVTRAGKGSPLTNNEVDANFVNLNTDKIESITSADGSVVITATGTARDLSVGTAASTGTLISQVRNETGATLTKGTVVYISGAAGNKALVSKALANADATSAQTYGVIQADISNNQNGYVVVVGAVSGINTIAYPDGTQLYLSGTTAGEYTSTKPYAPTHLVYVGIVTYSHATQGTIQVKIQNGYEMDELHNVSAQTPSNGNTLVYNTSTSLWEKNTVSLTAGVNGTLPPANGGTGITSLGSGVATFLGTPSSANLAAAVTDETGTGALVFANSPTLVTPALGTPASATLTNATGLPISTGVSGLGTGVATFLATPSSANLKAALTDETGSGAAVFATSPTLVTPALGTPSSATLTNATGLPIASGVSGLGTGIATALAVNVGTSGAPVINGGALGTPSSGTVTNLTGTASININGTVGATTPSTGNFTTLNENSVAVVTQSDIGTGANEIPLNQYLGSLAYQNGDAYYNTGMTVGFRNRIINGAMVIDQRNAGAEVTITDTLNYTYTIDRWAAYSYPTGSKFSCQQSSTAPTGFTKSFKVTSLSAYSIGSSDIHVLRQAIEGFNVFDLAWGTSNAKPITLSFWVYSSVTGVFSGALTNVNFNRSYPFTYTINTANTWEQKTIIVSGDTTGTWNTDNTAGINLNFSFGVGSSYSGTAGSWSAADYRSATGATSLLATNGATLYITGVQIEKGNIATSFDVRPYGTELALCQRYCWVSYTTSGNGGPLGTGAVYSATLTQVALQLPVSMRTAPTATTVLNGSSIWCGSYVGATGTTTATTPAVQTDLNNLQNIRLAIDGLSGMTAGQATWTFTAANAKLILSAEL